MIRHLMIRHLMIATLCAATILPATMATAAEAPAVEEILARHAEALGGVKRRAAKALKLTGTFNFNGIDSPYTVYRMRPDRFRFEIVTSGGTSVTAFDGETAWRQGPNRAGEIETRVMEGEDRQRFLDENVDFDSPLVDCEEKGHKAELLGEQDIDGVDAYHLKLTLASGNVQEWFISKGDHQAIRKITPAVHRRSGPYQRLWYLMEHQQTAGVTVPFYVEREDRQHVRAYSVQKVEIDPELDQGIFEMPPVSAEDP